MLKYTKILIKGYLVRGKSIFLYKSFLNLALGQYQDDLSELIWEWRVVELGKIRLKIKIEKTLAICFILCNVKESHMQTAEE